MTEARLKTGLWVQAQLRICDLACLPAAVARRGDPDAGSLVLRLNRLDGTSELFVPATGETGERAWMRAGCGAGSLPDEKADAYIGRQIDRDPDVWVLEIEDAKGRYELDAPVL